MNPELQAARSEALAAAAEALSEDDTNPFDPVPDGYYMRPEAGDEYRQALAAAGIHLTARSL